ncbi:MFS transporter, partial [Acinetobacter baumannii]
MKASLVSSKSSVDNNKTHSNLPRSVVLLFAIASGVSVANVYYAQPLLDILASDFNISHAAIG